MHALHYQVRFPYAFAARHFLREGRPFLGVVQSG